MTRRSFLAIAAALYVASKKCQQKAFAHNAMRCARCGVSVYEIETKSKLSPVLTKST